MATINAARALGRENELGSIELGKKADFFLIDLTHAHSIPVHDLIASIVFYSPASDVTTVVIDGKIVMHDSSIITVDEARALKETEVEAEDLVNRAGIN